MSRGKGDEATGRLWVEEGERREGLVATVAPIVPVRKTYAFAVPEPMASSIAVGQRVRVPMGRSRRLAPAFVIGLDRREWTSTLDEVADVVDSASYLTPELIELGRRISRYYACPLGLTLKAMTPEAVRRERGLKAVRYAQLVRPFEDIESSGLRRSARRVALLNALQAAGGPVTLTSLMEGTGASAAVLRGLQREGWIDITVRREQAAAAPGAAPAENQEPGFTLTDDQQRAVAAIAADVDAARFAVSLLYGVSGSGKTEVYVYAIRRAIAARRQAILLVPEIMLTTQLVDRLAARFTNTAVVHSAMTETERSLIWRRVAAGEANVVIGTRSAVFAPCPRLGLICVDEEQETSYKNLQAPRFHVRDVAILRAHQLGVPVVLGSATPSMETWHNSAHREGWKRLVLPGRVKNLPMPAVHVVDMRDEYREQGAIVLVSRAMERMLGETLAAKGQAVVLLNRRGYANRIRCEKCQSLLRCPHCTVGMVLHSGAGESRCHYCHTRMMLPAVCPTLGCGGRLVPHGAGTQRVEDVLARLFPDAAIRRADSDTMKSRAHYQQVVEDFAARRIDVLVGTQMIAKGLDFPAVSFVGVVDADTGPMESDFRAQEHLFQLLTQVAGRAGRAEEGGRVVIQTMMPESAALCRAARHDFEGFAAEEIEARRRTGLPPFARLARVLLAHAREETVRQEAGEMAQRIRSAIPAAGVVADVLGPQPCSMPRLRGRYRYDLLLRCRTAGELHSLIERLEDGRMLRSKAKVMLDVDPVSLV